MARRRAIAWWDWQKFKKPGVLSRVEEGRRSVQERAGAASPLFKPDMQISRIRLAQEHFVDGMRRLTSTWPTN
jgi:hypothetical protein